VSVDTALTRAAISCGLASGLDAVGVAAVEPFVSTREDLESRKAAGLHAGMAFTYRNPERSTSPGRILPGAASMVVGAKAYRRDTVEPPEGATWARVARYAWTDTYAPLRSALSDIAAHLRNAGWKARVVADDNALVDREAAARAGLGWYGKNANLLLPGRGSWFVLGSVITDAPLEPAGERQPDGCGSCHRCLDGCPTGAIISPGVVDSRRCLAWLVQAKGVFPRAWREALGDRIYGCDDCQEVCPPNRRRAGSAGSAGETSVRPWVDVLAWLAMDDDALLAAAGSWYVPARAARYLRRNALLVLGNSADGADPAVLAALDSALGHPDAMVRAHAVWAAGRLGRPDLAATRCGHDDDPDVRAELEALAEVAPSRRASASRR
jgi:epoxyqueuosine reductase